MLFQDAANAIATHAAACSAVYEVIAEWSADPASVNDDPRLHLLLADAGAHQGWHSELWAARIPQTYVQACVAIDTSETDAVERARAVHGAAARVHFAATEMIARRVAAYDSYVSQADAMGDGPGLRVVELARRDCVEDMARLLARLTVMSART